MTRWLLLGAAILLFVMYGWPLIRGKSNASPLQTDHGYASDHAEPAERASEATCDIAGPRFSAKLTSKGAAIRELRIDDEKYQRDSEGKPTDLAKGLQDYHLPLRTVLRQPHPAGAKEETPEQVKYTDFDWTLEAKTPTSCTFSYEDEAVSIKKTIATGDRPFELAVALVVTNKAKEARSHRLTIESDEWHSNVETKSSFAKRQSEWETKVEAYGDGKLMRWGPADFDPKKLDDGDDFTAEKWRRAPGDGVMAAVSSSYFSKAILHVKAPQPPTAETFIEEYFRWKDFPEKEQDPEYGHTYRARLNYGAHTLAPGESASYEMLAFTGPKERGVLAQVGGGSYPTTELLNLGYFGWIGKWLIRYLYFLYGIVKAWGWAIALLTITVKLLLFPLSIAQIKSTMAMRKLKPEMDALNAKYKDDAQQRGLALQELWRKNKVANPMLGCLPVLLQMPVWWALYQALQTAVELYHTPFGPFIPDLSAPGKYFIIPAVLGASSWLQQQLMPMQGDPAQQRMMKWMMPAIFTVMMLFLPAGLGIYFLTNTWLGIIQQIAVERYYQSRKETAEEPAPVDDDKAFGKGKSRVQQRG